MHAFQSPTPSYFLFIIKLYLNLFYSKGVTLEKQYMNYTDFH